MYVPATGDTYAQSTKGCPLVTPRLKRTGRMASTGASSGGSEEATRGQGAAGPLLGQLQGRMLVHKVG